MTEYVCQRCGACCRWPGDVRVTEAELERIAAFLGLDVGDLIRDCTRLAHARQGLALTENADGSCVFLTPDNACRIHAVKPQQCRDFPTRWRVPGFDRVCRAVPAPAAER